MTTYLVTGASGQLGQLAVEHLAKLVPSDDIITLVRSDAASESYLARGITSRRGDYNDRESLGTAMEGVDRVLLISASEVGKRSAQHQNVIDAAKAAGVKFIAYTSLLNADAGGMSLATEHLATEAALRDSGIPHAILRNGWYNENYAMGAAQSVAMGQHFGAAGEGRFASAARQDFAEAAAVVLAGEGHVGKVYELGGDSNFNLTEFAAILSDLSGKTVVYVDLEEAAFREALINAGLPEPIAAMLSDSDARAAEGALATDSTDLSRLIGRPTTPIRETMKAVLS